MHRKYWFTILMLSAMTTIASGQQIASEQQYKKFKIVLGLGINATKTNSALEYCEPSYRITPDIRVSLRFDLIKTLIKENSVNTNGKFPSATTLGYSLNGKYYFHYGKTKRLKPYAGLGVGFFTMYVDNGTYIVDGEETTVASGGFLHYTDQYGIYPCVGFDWGHLNLSLQYNAIPSTTLEVVKSGMRSSLTIKNSYPFISIGFAIGGGKKK
jgi:outer membrane protein W